jgi:hypothetical protein
MKKFKVKFLTLAVMVGLGLFFPVINISADTGNEIPETDDVPIILRAHGDAQFLNISLFNAGELVFNDINHYSNHNTWIDPQVGNIVDIVIDSSRPWTLAIEGDNFVNIEDPSEIVGLNRLRTRVQRAVLPNGQIINTNTNTNSANTSGSGVTGNQIGADSHFRTLTATGRQQQVVTNRTGRNFTYRMQFQFQGDQNIAEGEYQGAIRYAVWQR